MPLPDRFGFEEGGLGEEYEAPVDVARISKQQWGDCVDGATAIRKCEHQHESVVHSPGYEPIAPATRKVNEG